MANGCSNQRRFLIVAAFILLAMELKTTLCQQVCSSSPILLRAEHYKKFAHTPNYPRKYPKNVFCKWTIKADPGYTIRFKVEQSFIEAPTNGCIGDYAEVFDGNTSKRTFCGSDTPEVISTTDVLHVVFESDSWVETMGMNFSYYSGKIFPTINPTTVTPKPKAKQTNKVTLFVAIGAAVLCSALFVIVLCVCMKRCGCPCKNTVQTVQPFTSDGGSSLPTDEVISLRVLSPPPYISRSPPSIDSPTNSSSPPPPYSLNDPHPGVGQTDSLPSYPGEVSRY